MRHALAGRSEIPVAAGADESVGALRYPVILSDEERYWQERIAPAPGPVSEALLLLKRSIEAGATVIAIGPYTNLRLFDHAYPGPLGSVPLYLMGQTPEQGAQTSIYLASSPEVAGITGKYFAKCRPIESSEYSRNPNVARRLWQVSEKWTGLKQMQALSGPAPLPAR